jgi:prepilin-type N-terminal cleavage/methylation domain-containing protein
MMKPRKGTTLIEVMITMGIIAMLMGIIVMIFREGLRFYRTGASDVQTFQYGVLTLDRMTREIQDKTTLELYFPAHEDLMIPQSTPGIVFVKRNPQDDTLEVIGYYLDEATKEVKRVLYDPAYDPEDPATQVAAPMPGSTKIMARNILKLTFQGEDKGLLKLEIVLNGEHETRYLRTKIQSEALVR